MIRFMRDATGQTIGSLFIDKVPSTITYGVRFRAWAASGVEYHTPEYVGTIFPEYRYADGTESRTRKAWEVDGSDARFYTIAEAAEFLALRHLSDAAFDVQPASNRDATLDTHAMEDGGRMVTWDGGFFIHGRGSKPGSGEVRFAADGRQVAAAYNAPLALPEWAGRNYCATCGESTVGSDSRYFKRDAGYIDGAEYCPRHYFPYINANNPAWATHPGFWNLPAGDEPTVEADHLNAMIADENTFIDNAVEWLERLGKAAAAIRGGALASHADALLNLAEKVERCGAEMAAHVRTREAIFYRVAVVNGYAEDMAADHRDLWDESFAADESFNDMQWGQVAAAEYAAYGY